MLYKFTTSRDIAEKISLGIYRFYELTKYIKIEDRVGRADSNECSVSFTDDEINKCPDRLPVGSFNGVNFKIGSYKFDDSYVSQYFVFCASQIKSVDVMTDTSYFVELYEDVFQTLELVLSAREQKNGLDTKGRKFFSHGEVEYYNINKHPEAFHGKTWREVYRKHSDFEHQQEYRAALFVSSLYFDTVELAEVTYRRAVYAKDHSRMSFDLTVTLQAGRDSDGWRFIEIDTTEFSKNLGVPACNVVEINSALQQLTQAPSPLN